MISLFLLNECCLSLWSVGMFLSTANEATKAMLLERQKEYRTAALRAKKQGDVEQAKLHVKTSKVSLNDLFEAESPVQKGVVVCIQDICWS